MIVATWNGCPITKDELFAILQDCDFLDRHKVKDDLVTSSLIGYYQGQPIIRRISSEEYRVLMREFRQVIMDGVFDKLGVE